MNARLRKVKDGAGAMHRNEVVWFEIVTGEGRRSESGEIYWPFALVWDCATSDDDDPRYNLTHLPSGYNLIPERALPRRSALRLIKRLRALPVDLGFTKPVGRKWEAAKPALARVARPYRVQQKPKTEAK